MFGGVSYFSDFSVKTKARAAEWKSVIFAVRMGKIYPY